MSVAADRAVQHTLAALAHDEENDRLLEQRARAHLEPFAKVSDALYGGAYPGQLVLDPGVAPLWALAFAGMFTGARIPSRLVGETDEQFVIRARAEMIAPRSMLRGSKTSLLRVADAYLTGTRTMIIVERVADSAWNHVAYVDAAEVSSMTALTAALNDEQIIPAGSRITVEEIVPGTWTVAMLEELFYGRSIADLEQAYMTVADVESNTRI